MFQRDVNGASQIWLTNSKGTRTRPLTAKQVDSALPRWGPNGHRILYIRAARRGLNDTDLMVMGARGRHNRVLLPGQGRNIIDDLAWAPGGLRVVLVMTRLNADQDYVDADLWVYNPRTRRLRKLNALPGRMVTSVDWSRAGIVFSAFDFYGEPRGKADLYAIRPNGSGLRQVTNTPTRHEERPRFSPDGLRLVYTAAAGRCRTLIVTNAGGRNPRRTGVGCNARGASWSPDSRRLLAQLRTRRQEMWDIRVDGSDKRFIAPGAQGSWRPQ